MSRSQLLGLIVVIVIVIVVVLFWPRPPKVLTTLELEANGGFAYLQSRGTMDIAYLPQINAGVCQVPAANVRLWVVRGTVVAPAATPEKREFNLLNTVVRFPDMKDSPDPLTVKRGPRPGAPFQPTNPADPLYWKDLKWIARVYDKYEAPHHPPSAVRPDVLDKVNGRVVLTHGTLEGKFPSDVVMQNALFEFKKTPTGPVEFTQALTDRTVHTVRLPGDQIVINLTGSTEGITQIIVKPDAPGQPVKLKMIGLHDEATPPTVPLGMPVHHFCAFYQLLEPVPPTSDQMLPYFAGNPTLTASAKPGQPSPGPVCVGDF